MQTSHSKCTNVKSNFWLYWILIISSDFSLESVTAKQDFLKPFIMQTFFEYFQNFVDSEASSIIARFSLLCHVCQHAKRQCRTCGVLCVTLSPRI